MTTIIEQGTTDLGLDEAIVVSGLSIHGIRIADLRVRRGEVVALVGPNGAGKSTVSRAVVGARPAAEGSVRVLGLDPFDDRDELKLRVGFLVKDLETMGSLNSRDVLDICAAVRDCTASFALELAERLRLDLDRPMGQLSRGQLRRLGLVQALMHRPDVIVLDDPMTDLDDHGRRELAVVLRDVATTGTAVLMTATSADDVEGCATRIVPAS
ncbi:ABC transporter family protein [Kribbella steppae]|uniref:ABC transporter family protein n=1 Tax=Kribbella steppae TaxID=2512223 RepID=A0A4R2H796_9ACTN|nr:ABC transporter ATP-binding protein [Kribbella steppae]TCO20315.1 ABC transporter family protein [Kribbella steppae]